MVYSFDSDLNFEAIDELKELYEIGDVPVALINEEDKVVVRNIDDLDPYI